MSAGPLHFKKTIHRTDSSQICFKAAERSEIETKSLPGYASGWKLDGEYRSLSPQTISTRTGILDRLQWFLEKNAMETCGVTELRAFIGYVAHGDGARWDNTTPGLFRNVAKKPIRPSTIKTYHSYLASFFSWLVGEGVLTVSPMLRVASPIDREKNRVTPFSPRQIDDLLRAAVTGPFPARDEAIVLFLLDTGVRASELVSLKMGDLDRTNKTASVIGKGNKRRIIRFGVETSRALWRYICTREDGMDGGAPFFVSENDHTSGCALTRDGLGTLIERLGKAAGIQGVRCSPHTLRHTFAISFLRAGGNSFALQQLLGHSDMKMTAKYVMIAQCDLAEQHAMASPVDNLRKRR